MIIKILGDNLDDTEVIGSFQIGPPDSARDDDGMMGPDDAAQAGGNGFYGWLSSWWAAPTPEQNIG